MGEKCAQPWWLSCRPDGRDLGLTNDLLDAVLEPILLDAPHRELSNAFLQPWRFAPSAAQFAVLSEVAVRPLLTGSFDRFMGPG